MRKIVIALGLLLVSGMAAFGANLSLLSGPQDPSQLNATINGVIRSINSTVAPNGTGTTGSAIYIPTISTGTPINALAIYPGIISQGVTITVGPSLGRAADTNVDLNIVPRGDGFIQFAKSFTANGAVSNNMTSASLGPTGSHT